MKSNVVVGVAFFALALAVPGSVAGKLGGNADPICNKKGVWDLTEASCNSLSIDAVKSYDDCLNTCKNTVAGCESFTFSPAPTARYASFVNSVAVCETLAGCTKIVEDKTCPTCISGQKGCTAIGEAVCNADFCYQNGKVIQVIRNVPDVAKCHEYCNNSTACAYYSFYKATLSCQLLQDTPPPVPGTVTGKCLSGQQGCEILGDPECAIKQACNGDTSIFGVVGSADQCLQNCQLQTASKCKWFTYHLGDSICYFSLTCSDRYDGDGNYVSGESRCTAVEPGTTTTTTSSGTASSSSGGSTISTTTTPTTTTATPPSQAWHLIVGGAEGKDMEAFNYATGQNCSVKDKLPDAIAGVRSPSANIISSNPVLCGGQVGNGVLTSCYKYSGSAWTLMAPMQQGTRLAGSGFVSGNTWHVYGGYDLNTTQIQTFDTTGNAWSTGYGLYGSQKAYGHCALLKNSNEGVILGGGINQKSILTLDLTTGAYTPAPRQLSVNRYRPACAKGSKGEFYIAGGYGSAKGMEVWYPDTGEVSTVSSELPAEVGQSGSLYDAQLMPINGGGELLLYGGRISGKTLDQVWKFSTGSKTWSYVGHMFQARAEHVVYSVASFTCPTNY